MHITVHTINHVDQRYETIGDWIFNSDNDLHIFVSDLGNPVFNFLVAIHEEIEAVLCQQAGVTGAAVDEFDALFELERSEGAEEEPGDSPDAPYYEQHVFATKIEKELAAKLNVSWEEYEAAIYAL